MASAELDDNKRHLPLGFQSSSQAYEALIDFGMHAVSGGAWKVLSYIARRTVGFAKDADAISLSQICAGITTRDGRRLDYGTGLSRKTAVRALGELQARGYVSISRHGGAEVNSYRLELDSVRCQKETSSKRKLPGSGKKKLAVVSKLHSQETVLQPTVLQATEERKADSGHASPKSGEASPAGTLVCVDRRPSIGQSQVAAAKCALSDGDLADVGNWMAAFMDGEQPSAELLEGIAHMAAEHGFSADNIHQALDGAWSRNARPGRKDRPRLWNWFFEALRNALIEGYWERHFGP